MTVIDFPGRLADPLPVKGGLTNMSATAVAGVKSAKASPSTGVYVHPLHAVRDRDPVSCYRDGCRHPDCRRAATLRRTKHRVQRERNGPAMEPAGPWREALQQAVRAGVNTRKLSRLSGVPYATIRRLIEQRAELIRIDTAEKLRAPLRDMLEYHVQSSRQALKQVNDIGKEPKRHSTGPRLYPTAAVRAAVDRYWGDPDERTRTGVGPPWTDTERAYLYHVEMMDRERAERMCEVVGIDPESVFDNWWEPDGLMGDANG